MAGHAAHDKYESYMPMELLAEWSDKDPLKRLEQSLREERAIDEAKLEGIRDRRSRTRCARRSSGPSRRLSPIPRRRTRASSPEADIGCLS